DAAPLHGGDEAPGADGEDGKEHGAHDSAPSRMRTGSPKCSHFQALVMAPSAATQGHPGFTFVRMNFWREVSESSALHASTTPHSPGSGIRGGLVCASIWSAIGPAQSC